MRNYIPNAKSGTVGEGLKPPVCKTGTHRNIVGSNPTRSTISNEDKKEDFGSMITNPVIRDLFDIANSMTFEISNQTVWEKVKKGIYDAIKNSPFVSGVTIQCDKNTNTPSLIRNNLIGLRVSYYDHYLNKRDSMEFTIPLKITED